MQRFLNLCHCTSMERHLDKRSFLFFWLTSLHRLQQQQQNYRNSNSNNNNKKRSSKKNTRQTTVESREAISLGRRLGCYCLPISEQLSPERGCGLSLLIMPLPKAKGKVPKKQRTSSKSFLHKHGKCRAKAEQLQRQMPAVRCEGRRGGVADEMREQQQQQQPGPLGTIQTRANAAHNCN